MPRISLASYTLRVTPKYRPSDHEVLRCFGDRDDDLLEVLDDFLHRLDRDGLDDDRNLSILRLRDVYRDGDTIFGRLLVGDYGYTAELVDVETRERTYDRRTADAELVPLYFSVTIPPEHRYGVAVFQRFGGTGVRTSFANALHSYFSERFASYVIRMNAQLPQEVLRELLQSQLKAIQMITYTVPSDVTDVVRTGEYDANDAYLVQEIRAKKRKALRKPAWLRDLEAGRIQIAEIPDQFENDFDVLKLVVEYNGTRRTIDFSRPDRLSPFVDVSAEVELVEGHPRLESIRRVEQDITQEMLERMGYAYT